MFRYFRNCVSNSLKAAKRDYYTGIILENKYKLRLMWKCLKELLPGKSKASPKGLLIDGLIDGQSITDKLQMANTFNEYFTSIGQDLARQLPSATPFIPPNNPPDIPAFKFPVVTAQFVERQHLSMPENKAVGLDILPGRLLRAAAPVIAHPLAYIFNLSLQSGIFINDWKYATVIPLFKSGPAMERNNYRPISILPILSKVLERFVHTSFTVFLEEFKLLTVKYRQGFGN